MTGRRINSPAGRTLAALAGLAAALALAPAARSSDRDGARYVREGIRHHQAGQYDAAEAAFAKAADALPADPRVAFNQACTLAAQGKSDEAETLFQSAAAAGDASLVAASHYNLGCLAAQAGKDAFGERPEEATGEARQDGMRLIHQAVEHYRDCLGVEPQHARARRNLELLRLWIKHIQDVWKQRDRQRRRDEMDLLQFIEWLQQQQRSLRAAAKSLAGIEPSPQQRQQVSQTEATQRELSDEVAVLPEKIDQALRPPQNPPAGSPAGPTAGPPPAHQQPQVPQQLIAALKQIAADAQQSARQAADDLARRDLPAAVETQTKVLDKLNVLYEAVAPFEVLLRKSIGTQETLVEASQQAIDSPTSSANAADPRDAALDTEPQVEDQRLVARWANALAQKATALLAAPPTPAAPADNGADPAADAQQQRQQARQAAAQKAVELTPRIHDLAAAAADLLAARQWPDALPKQEEALKLLQEIADELPEQEQQPPNQDQQQDQDKQQDQDQNQDQQQDQQQDGDGQDQQKKEQQDPGKQKESPDQRKQAPQKQQRELSRQQAEAMLSQVRQREREHRQRQKEFQRLLRAGIKVDKDW